MASPIWWTWVWLNSGSWWWTGRPGMLQFMGSRLGNRTELNWYIYLKYKISNMFIINRYFCLYFLLNSITMFMSHDVKYLLENASFSVLCISTHFIKHFVLAEQWEKMENEINTEYSLCNYIIKYYTLFQLIHKLTL